MTDSQFGPFKPSTAPSVPVCTDEQVGGKPSGIFSYIAKANNDDPNTPYDNPYAKPQCTPYYHSTAKIDYLQVSQDIDGGGTCTFPNFVGNINVQSWKGFDISHPKKEGKRIRHICVEGPEAAIYIRGRCENTNVINLPEYWDGLVDLDQISVNLTPFGSQQNLFVEQIKWGKQVIIKNADGGPVNCFYQVWAPRLGELHVEYDGESAADYPGDHDHHSICGYDYDVRGQKEN